MVVGSLDIGIVVRVSDISRVVGLPDLGIVFVVVWNVLGREEIIIVGRVNIALIIVVLILLLHIFILSIKVLFPLFIWLLELIQNL